MVCAGPRLGHAGILTDTAASWRKYVDCLNWAAGGRTGAQGTQVRSDVQRMGHRSFLVRWLILSTARDRPRIEGRAGDGGKLNGRTLEAANVMIGDRRPTAEGVPVKLKI